ncbi:MAG: gliding motility-associated C-terminal domain-containing protein [Flavobacteriales bacterium]|nr:gliding motility-associated C-terminal domain-containing protein [Flavobacteriales bacterium]
MRNLLIIVFLFTSWISTDIFGQCTNSSSYGSATAPTSGTTTISSIQYQSEYSTISSVVAGTTYQSAYSGGGCITVTQGSPTGTVIATGNTPLQWTATVGGTYYVHYTTSCSPTCGTATTGYTSSITYISGGGGGGGGSAPSNDNPCNAIPLTVGTSCSYSTYTNANATATSGIPAPGCASYSGGDVWFTATVPASGSIQFDSQTGVITDGGMAVYTATSCSGTFTLLDCDDDGSSNGAMSAITLNSLTPGQTLYIRMWEYGNNNNGTFGICAVEVPSPPACGTSPAAGNTCGTATPICDLNGYCGSTASTYTDNSWAQLDAGFSGSIENNSFISFVASGTSMTFNVWPSNCNSSSGIQIYVFGGGCSGAITEHLDWNPGTTTNATLTATGLTPGNTYYIMVDGNGGAVCDYTIGASTGVSIPVDAGPDVTICLGESTSLSATGGDGSYTWSPSGTLSGSSGTTVTATPTTTTTYTATSATGNPLCPSSTTDDVTVTVTSGGNLTVGATSALSGSVGPSSGSVSVNICNGGSATLSVSGASGGPTAYTWTPSTGLSCTNCANPTASPTSTTTYSVTATNASGCDLLGTVTVNVTPAPTVSVNSGTMCENGSVTLTASGMTSYSWSPSTGLSGTSGASVTASPTSTTTYTVTGSTTGCPNDTETSTVTVTPLPNPNFSISGNQCLATNSITLTNTGTAGTYSWSIPSGSPSTSTSSSVTTSYAAAGTYNVTLTTTTSGCTDAITIPVTINPNPTVTVTPTPVNCNGACDGSITAVGAGTSGYTYNWGGAGTGSTLSNQCAGTYNVTMTDINGCQATGSGTITQPAVLTASGTPGTISCNGGTTTITITATGGTTPYSGTGTFTLGAGPYSYTVTDAKGCTSTVSGTLTEPTPLVADDTPGTITCNGGTTSVVVTASGGTPAYSGTGTFTVSAGAYSYTVTDGGGCTSTVSGTITEPTAIVPSIVNQTNVLCNGQSTGSVTIGATGGSGSYTYNIGGGAQASGSFTGLAAGSYTVTVSDAADATCTETINVTISEPPALTASIAPVALSCNGDADGQATVTAGGGSGSYSYSWNNTTFDNTATTTANLAAGTYTVTVADAVAPTCTTTASVTVTEPTVISLSETSTPANCGATDGTATVTASGGTGTFTNYNWTPAPGGGQGTANATGLAAGSYTVVVTDNNSCSNTITVVVSNNLAPTISEVAPSHVDVDCNGASTGEAEVSASGGTGALTYAWSPSGGTSTAATGLAAGTYSVTVTDANNCSDAVTITITQPTPLNAVATVTSNVSCNGGTDGAGSVNVSGGTTSYSYQWFTSGGTAVAGATSSSATGLTAGDYYVEITDGNTCTTTSNTISITEPAAVTGTGVETPLTCNGDNSGSINLTPSGGDGSYSFAWTGPSGFTSNVEDPTGLAAGTYNVTITDGAGCTGTASVTVTEPSAVTVTASGNDAHCAQTDGDVTATGSGGSGALTYEWYSDATLSTSAGSGASVGTLAAGTYYVEVSDANGCTETTSVTIGDLAGPTVSAVVNSDATGPGLCNGNATATGTGGTGSLTYAWDNSNTNANANDLCAGSNCVTVTDAFGCTDNTCVTINEPNGVTVVIAPTDLLCNGVCIGQADVTATGGVGGYTYAWDHGPTAEDLTGLCAGTYNVTVTDANGNIGTGSVTIAEPAAIGVTSTSFVDALCNGDCNGEVDASATGGTGTLVYEWFDASNASVGSTANTTGLCAGDYDLVVTDDNLCTSTSSVTVSEPTALSLITANVSSNCGQADGEVSVTVSGGTAVSGYTYLWEDTTPSFVGATASVTGLVAGTYTLTVTDDNGCSETATTTISDLGGPTITQTHIDANCNGSFDGSIDITVSGGSTPFTYAWSGPNGYTSTFQDINLLEAGVYDVSATDVNGCVANLSITVNEPPLLVVNPTAVNATCFGSSTGELDATSTGGTGAATYIWYDDALLSNSVGTGASLTNMAAGIYYVEATDVNSCSASGTISINEPANMIVSTTATDANCGQADGLISVSATSGGSGIYVSEVWIDAASNPVTNINAVASGSYTVTVTDDQGCTGTAVQGVSDLIGPSLSILSAASASCAGYCDGTAFIEAVGGTPTYIYTWNPAPGTGQGTPSVTGLCAGNYNVSVSDDNGCTDNIVVTILEPAPLVASITGNTDVTINGAADGTATASASGGTPAYTYDWYSSCPPGTTIGQTVAGASGLAAGTYSVVVEDSKGCLDTVCTTIDEPSTLNIVEAITDVTCFSGNDGEISITVSGGVPGYTYEWFDAATSTSTGQTGITASGLTAGDYYVVVVDQNGATQQSQDFTVAQPTQLTLVTTVTSNYNGSDISCFGECDGSVSVTASGGTTPYSYAWDAATGSQTAATATGLCDGTYSINVLDGNNCPATETITVVEPTQLVNTPSQTDASCYAQCDGEAVTSVVGGTGTYTYQWNNPGLSTTATISSLCAGTYDVTITDVNNCIINESFTITEPTELVLSGNMNGSNCNQNDGSATVTIVSGDAPFTYQWDANAGSQTTATASTLFAGSYNVVVTDGNGCTNDTTISVQDLGAPTVTILTQTDVSCNGGSDGFAQIQVTDGTAPYVYTWEDCSGNNIGQSTASALNLAAGCYNGSMVDAVGCQGTVSVTIDEPTALNALITSTTDVTCFGYTDGIATVTAGGGTAPYTYLWSDLANQTTATATGLAPGTYQVTVTDDNGCTITATATINEPAEIQLSTSVVDAFCATGTGSATVTVAAAGVSPFTYNWTPTSQATDVATGLIPGTYDVTVTDADGCIQTAQAIVGDIPPGTATIGTITDVSCNTGSDGTIDVSMSGTGTAPYTYQWFNATSNTALTGQTAVQATGLPAGDYYVEVTDANGCFSTSNTGTINEPTAIQISDAITDALCNGSSDGTAEAIASGGTQPYSYLWNDPLNQTSITANGLEAGSYTVTVTDDNNCVETHNVTIGEPTAITIDSTVTNANCGQPDGQACVTPTGGTGPYTYLWPDGSTNTCAINLLASTYIVTVEDQNGCQELISVEVADLGGPVADIISFTEVSCNSFTDGQATVDMTSGNGTSFTVLWDANTGNQTTPTASNLGAGTYSVTITDDLGCNASTSVTISEPDALAYNITTSDATCFTYCDGEANITVIGGTTPYSYEWLDNVNNTIGAASSINGLCAGNYGINVTDANNCTFTDNLTILEPMQVTGNIIGQNITCFNACNGQATATGDVGNAPFSFVWDAGTGNQTGSVAQNLCPGTYEVTITDDDGCVGTETVTITEPTLLTSSISQSGNITCNGFCDGFAQGSAAGGTAPYQYSWSNSGGGNQLATNLCAGAYTMTVTDDNGCTTTSNITLTQPQALSASATTTNLSCFQSCDGSASVSVSGGVTPYAYQWNNSTFATTSSFANECAGTYTVQVTDDNGCQLSETVIITQPTDISISANITNSNCGQDNGQVCANVNGGTSPYSYQWNDPNTQTGACALNLFAGCYTFTVTDGNACIKDTLLCVNDIAGPTVTAIASVDVTCFGAGNGSVEFTSTGGTGSLSHEIVDGSGVTVNTGSTIASSLDGDCYTLISTDAAGCVASDVICVAEPNALNAAVIQSSDALCFQVCDGTALAAANGGVTPYTYSWNSGATPTQSDNSGLCAGTYTVTVTDDNNCSTQANVTIDEPDDIIIAEVITDVTCFSGGDGTIDITVSGGTPFFLYTWSTGSTSEDIQLLSAGNYQIDIDDANGCHASETYTITEPTQVVPSFVSFNSPTCEQCNGTALVSATGGTGAFSYQWSSGNTATSTSNSGMCPGLQEVTVTDANGCSMTISQMMVNQASPQIDSMVYTGPSCNGLTNGSATVYPSGIFDPNQMTYLWNAATNNQQTSTAVALGDGIYCVTVTDPNGCTASSCVDVIEPTPLNAVPDGSTTICYGEDTQIWASGQGGTAPYTILWTPVGFSGTGPILVSPTVTTDYCFKVEDDNGCLSSQACVSIIVREPLSLDMTPSTSICDGDSFDISALGSGGIPSDYVFSWQDGSNSAVPATTVNDLSTVTVAPTEPTWYYVTLNDGCSISATDSAQISINALPIGFLSAVDSSGCEPFSAQFIANSDIGVTYEYDINCDGVYESSTSNSSFNYTFTQAGTYDVCMNVISAAGCSTLVSNNNFIEVYPVPVADFSTDPSSTTILTPEITLIDNSTGANTYDWDFGDGYLMTGNPTTTYNGEENTYGLITLPTHTFNDTGYYEVTLLVTSDDGCTSLHTETIYIEGDYTFYTPNAFSPNGDGDNDTFRPLGIGIDEDNYEFYIFNRWGQLIYEGYDPYDEWDGKYNNVMSQTDVYVWLVKTRDNEGNPKEYRGHVTLVK